MLAGCGGGSSEPDASAEETSTPSTRTSATLGSAGEPTRRPTTAPPSTAPTTRGIDASHHQGVIDWPRVADAGIEFAYLKATEGSSFTDPRFADNWAAARAAGIRPGGYHYYTLCSPPEAQADHFLATLGAVETLESLPPVVDLELIGNCDPPPPRDRLRDQVQTFIDRVEEATGRKVVVYFHPDFEAHYDLVEAFDRRLWVRRVGDRPPPGDWFLWQRNDQATVAGIEGPVDLNLMR